jgi:hypothetical protein
VYLHGVAVEDSFVGYRSVPLWHGSNVMASLVKVSWGVLGSGSCVTERLVKVC